MRGQVSSIDVQVKIVDTIADPQETQPPYMPQGPPAQVFDTRLLRRSGIRSVDVINSLYAPCGRFRLDFAPEALFEGRSWAELLRPYSLVAIALHRMGVQGDPSQTDSPEPVMLGVLDTPETMEDYSQAEPLRAQAISGRSLSAVLTDHPMYFHRGLATLNAESRADLLPADFRRYFRDPVNRRLWSDGSQYASREQALRSLGLLAVDPGVLLESAKREPWEIMNTAYQLFVTGRHVTQGLDTPLSPLPGSPVRGATTKNFQPAFIKLRFGDNVPLPDRLRFDRDKARERFVDPRATVMAQLLSSDLENANCWDLLRSFNQRYVQELYQDTRGSTLDDCYVEIVARKPPFHGQIVYPGNQPRVGFQGRPPDTYGQSLFDSWVETVVIDGQDILAAPLLQRGAETQQIFTLFEVQPAAYGQAGGQAGYLPFQALIPPIIDEDPESPSFILRFGVRPMRLPLIYIPVLEPSELPLAQGLYQEHAIAYEALLYEWYRRLPEMWRGTMLLRGRTELRVGRRLLDMSGAQPREYYITGVRHHMMLGESPQSTTFTTSVQVERGWDLN